MYSKLQNMPSSLSQAKSTGNSVEKLLRQLEIQREVVSNQRMLIITKFAKAKRDPTIAWTMES